MPEYECAVSRWIQIRGSNVGVCVFLKGKHKKQKKKEKEKKEKDEKEKRLLFVSGEDLSLPPRS